MEEVGHFAACLVWLCLKQMADESQFRSPVHDLWWWQRIVALTCNSCVYAQAHIRTVLAELKLPVKSSSHYSFETQTYSCLQLASSALSPHAAPFQWLVRLCPFVSFVDTSFSWSSRNSNALQCPVCSVTASWSCFHQVFSVNSQGAAHLSSHWTFDFLA